MLFVVLNSQPTVHRRRSLRRVGLTVLHTWVHAVRQHRQAVVVPALGEFSLDLVRLVPVLVVVVPAVVQEVGKNRLRWT